MKKKVLTISSFLALFIIIVIGLITPRLTQSPKHSEIQKSWKQMRMVRVACDLYASDHDGHYPPNLEALFGAEVLLEEHDRTLLYTNPSDPSTLKWLYTPGLTNTSEGTKILLKSRFPIDGHEIIATIDGSIKSQRLKE